MENAILVILAALRLSRFITTDVLGEWTIAGPAKRWAWRHEGPITLKESAETVPTPDPDWGWRSKAVSGLDCPACVGYWIGLGVVVADMILPRVPVIRTVWKVVKWSLALNYVVAQVAFRLDT